MEAAIKSLTPDELSFEIKRQRNAVLHITDWLYRSACSDEWFTNRQYLDKAVIASESLAETMGLLQTLIEESR